MRPPVVLLLVLAAIVAFVIGFFVMRAPPEGRPIGVSPTPGDAPTAPATKEQVSEPRAVVTERVDPAQAPIDLDDDNDVKGSTLSNSLVGMVVNDKNEPVGGAKITLSRDALMGEAISIQWFTGKESSGVPKLTTTSDEKGKYSFHGIEPSREYYLMAEHTDFSQIQEDLVAVTKNGESRAPDLVLRAGSHIVGQVTDVEGNIVPNARLDLDSAYMMSVEVASPDRLTVFADATGHYEFRSVAAGNRNLTCSADGYGLLMHHNVQCKGDPDERISQDFKLGLGHPIGGHVFGPDNEAVKGCKITAINYGSDTSSRGEAVTDDNGDFMITGLQAGAYILMINAEGLGYRQKQQNRVQADEVALQIAMIRQGSLNGRVFASTGNEPIKDFHCALLRVNSQPQQGPTLAMYEPTSVKQKFEGAADGSFTLKGVDAGTYALKVTAKGYAARLTDNFVVVDGQQTPLLTVGLSQGGSIRGRVVDSTGAPVAGASVSSQDNEFEDGYKDFIGGLVETRTTVRKARSDNDGFFHIKLLNPGKYQVQIEHPNFTTESVKNLVVTEGKLTDAGQAALKSGGTVRGRVTDQAGKPLSRGWVRLFNAEGKSFQARTDTEGRYSIEHVTPGPYTLSATRTAASGDVFEQLVEEKNAEVPINVIEGQISNRDINLGN